MPLMDNTMNASEFQSHVLQRAVEDHEIISQFTKAISRMFGSESEVGVKKAVQAIALLTNKEVVKHFTYEEAKVFAPLLASHPDRKTVKLVAKLQAEHKLLLKQIQHLNRTLKKHALPGDAGVLWQTLMRFLDTFEDHANKEDELFHCLLDGPPTVHPKRRARPAA